MKLIYLLTLTCLSILLPGSAHQGGWPHVKLISSLLSTESTAQPKILSGESDSTPQISNHVNAEGTAWRTDLPSKLQERFTLTKILIDGSCEVYLLGTSHVSESSCDDVRILMEHITPDCVFIELCSQRIAILSPPREVSNAPFREQIRDLQESGMSLSNALSTVLLTKVQSDYASKLNITIGAEFREAVQCAKVFRSRVILGDRPMKLTLLRAWESLNFWGKSKLIAGLIWSSLRQPSEKELKEWMNSILKDKNGDILTKSIEELSRNFPTLVEKIISERDEYMYAKLKQTARLGARRIVAVVGAGHCPGILGLADNANDDVEGTLRRIIETNTYKIEKSEDMKGLITDVVELRMT